ncbi:MAG: hypothetical protein ACYDEV_08015 [Acidiferrobacter sp.]
MKTKSMLLATGLLVVALPAFAAPSVSVSVKATQVALKHEGFSAPQSATIMQTVTQNYHGAALAQLATGLSHLPKLPAADYVGSRLKPTVRIAFAHVLTQSFTQHVAPRDVLFASQAFAHAVSAGTAPLTTARLVTQGLVDGLRGPALAKLASHYAVRIQRGMPETTAYRETLAMAKMSVRSPMGRPTGVSPMPMSAGMGASGASMGAGVGSATMTGGMTGGTDTMGRP